jgi:GH24 family phage-related lysozyme (muramidase)
MHGRKLTKPCGLAMEPEERLAAIVDFTFNLGAGRLQTSTLRRRVNQNVESQPKLSQFPRFTR